MSVIILFLSLSLSLSSLPLPFSSVPISLRSRSPEIKTRYPGKAVSSLEGSGAEHSRMEVSRIYTLNWTYGGDDFWRFYWKSTDQISLCLSGKKLHFTPKAASPSVPSNIPLIGSYVIIQLTSVRRYGDYAPQSVESDITNPPYHNTASLCRLRCCHVWLHNVSSKALAK